MLGTTKLRKDAMAIFEAGLDAVETKSVVKEKLKLSGGMLSVGRKKYNLSKYRRIFVIGIGKASNQAAHALEEILGDKITDGIVIDVKNGSLKKIKSITGNHPIPDEVNIRATGEIIGLLNSLDSQDLLIAIISGGGSALMCMPKGVEYGELQKITKSLSKKGADIRELNTVRKHLSDIKGGQFARMAHPATIIGLIFSDVPGDDLSMIASGPTVLDTTTVDDAARVLNKYDVLKSCSVEGCELKETPKDPVLFKHVHNSLLVSNTIAVDAMKNKAKKLGYKPRVFSTQLEGEARSVGKNLAMTTKQGEALIAAGETTVTVRKPGKGGRNQEVALGAMDHLAEGQLVASLNSDGNDHTPVAGGIGDEVSIARAEKKGLTAKIALEQNTSYDFFQKTRSYFRTGKTGINVSDLMLSLRKK